MLNTNFQRKIKKSLSFQIFSLLRSPGEPLEHNGVEKRQRSFHGKSRSENRHGREKVDNIKEAQIRRVAARN